MLKQLFANSSFIFAEFYKNNKSNDIYLTSWSEEISKFLSPECQLNDEILLDNIDFFSSNEQVNWKEIFNKVLKTKEEIIFEYDCFTFERYMEVKVFVYNEEHLVVLFNNITDQMEITAFNETLAKMGYGEIDYDLINEFVLKISGGSFAILNMFSNEGKSFITKSISGNSKIINSVLALMGIKLVGHEWAIEKSLYNKLANEKIIRYKSFRTLVTGILPEKLIQVVESLANIQEVYIVSIVKDGVLIGDINLLMKKGTLFRQKKLIEGIASQIGMVIQQAETRKELKNSREMFKSMFLQAPIGIGVVDLNKDKSYDINERYCEITGRSKDELLELDWRDITHPDDLQMDLDYTNKILNGEYNQKAIEKRYIKPDGSFVWVEMSIVPIFNEEGIVTHHIIMTSDISYRKKIAQRNEYLSYHDELTGLYNRHFYEAELKRLDTQRNLPISIIFADVNGLKMTNDAYGHNAGDQLLSSVSKIIKNECRKSEIVARVGGDEFIVLLPRTSKKQADKIVRRINKSLNETNVNNMLLSVSFGIAIKTHKDEMIEELIVSAEQEMYKSKLTVSQEVKGLILNNMLESLYSMGEEEKWHSIVISDLCKLMGQKLGFSENQIADIAKFGRIHDIGKVGLDVNVIKSTEKLNSSEWYEIKRHSEIGYQIVSAVNDFSSLAEPILSHHEQWDGSGYPNGLKGEEIPLFARILTVVDAYEAMTGNRGYTKQVLTKEDALKELSRNAGSQFDPNLVKIFKEVIVDYIDPRNN